MVARYGRYAAKAFLVSSNSHTPANFISQTIEDFINLSKDG